MRLERKEGRGKKGDWMRIRGCGRRKGLGKSRGRDWGEGEGMGNCIKKGESQKIDDELPWRRKKSRESLFYDGKAWGD